MKNIKHTHTHTCTFPYLQNIMYLHKLGENVRFLYIILKGDSKVHSDFRKHVAKYVYNIVPFY